ncbi:MAG: InlB B-repeat-containing protein, partial [Clostridia bacterium]|nr:InlB B-repeat-containing protein [Clostridia bacterium]
AEHKVESYVYGSDVTALEAPVKEGYTFSGWDKVAPATMPAENIVISGTFSINTYTITYMVDGAEHKVESYVYGSDVTALEAPVKEGYTFSGWDKVAPATMPAENIVISGTFTVNQYDAKFYVDGNVIATVATDFGKVPVAPDVTNAKPGYTFKNWDPALTEMTVDGADYYAVFEANDGIVYKVETYKMATDGETYELVSTEEFTGTAGDTAKYAVKDYEGFTFESGTNYDADANTISGVINGDGTTVLVVRYTRDQITVIVNGDKDTYYYGEEIAEPTAPTEPEGMEHTGWVDEDGNEVEFPYTVPTDENDEIVITPVFTPINYTVTFVSDGATVEQKEVAYGSKIEAPADPGKEGYRFIGWANEKGEYLKADTTMPAKAVTYTAVFEITTADVIYYVNGIPVGAVSCEYGQVISTAVPGYTVPTGYSLSAWYTDADCTVPFVEGTTYTTGVTKLYAKTTANEYKAIFNADGGEFADGTGTYEVMVAFDSEIPAPAAPVKEGYDFLGWDPMVGTMDEEGMTFTAIWSETVDFYTITYYVDYVDETTEPYEVFNVTFGEPLEYPSEPDKDGWAFVHWIDADGNILDVENTDAKMPAENLVYYAIFERSAANVTFYDYEATTATPWKTDVAEKASEAEVNFGEEITFPAHAEISEKYWIFLGWSTTEGGEVIDTTAITMGEGVATEYYAVYKKVAVKLVPKAGSTTMIERNGAIESYNDGYTVTDEFVATTDSTKNLIYGLRTGQRDSVLLATYVQVLGDGYAVVTPAVSGRLGTGTKVEVYDNADTSAPVETFYVVIFGDVDGNARVMADDSSAIDKEILKPTWSALRTRVEYIYRAANLNGDRRLTGDDGALVDRVIVGATLSQITGRVS